MGGINFIVDRNDINLTQLASRCVSRYFLDPPQQITTGRWGDIFLFFGGLRLKPIISPCLCERPTHWIISLINKSSLPKHNGFGSNGDVDLSVSVERVGRSISPRFYRPRGFALFYSQTLFRIMWQIYHSSNYLSSSRGVFSPADTLCLPRLTF